MKHADEGILHAWLDGELSAEEAAELERHLSVCLPCRTLLAEAKAFVTESDDLVLALDLPSAPKPLPVPRRVPWNTLAWAAMVVLALGTGYALRPALGPRAASGVLGSGPSEPVASEPSYPAPAAADAPAAPRSTPTARQAPSTAPRRAPASDLGTTNGAGAPAVAQGEALAAEREDRAAPAPAAAVQPSVSVPETPQPSSRLATVDGAPVDTSALQLSFGPRVSAPPQRITLDEAVTRLGGTIRLIDGLAPQRVEVVAGVDVSGADPDREVIRVYYEEPDLGLVTLDQQRPAPSFAARDLARRTPESEASASRVQVAPLGRSGGGYAARQLPAQQSITWRADGVWLSLTSRLSGDALAQLQARVK